MVVAYRTGVARASTRGNRAAAKDATEAAGDLCCAAALIAHHVRRVGVVDGILARSKTRVEAVELNQKD